MAVMLLRGDAPPSVVMFLEGTSAAYSEATTYLPTTRN